MSTLTIDLPGRFAGFFEGTGVAQGQTGDPELDALHAAWKDSRIIRRGRGRSYRLELPVDAGVLDALWSYADACLVANSDEPDHGEVAAARKVLERIEQLRAEHKLEGWRGE